MDDDLESTVNVRGHAPDGRYGETLLYDFAKTLTSLSLLVLGGVLTLGGTQQATDIPLSGLVLTSGAIALAGMLALSTVFGIVKARAEDREPPKNLLLLIKSANFLFGVGLGAFMLIWLESLK